MDELDELGVLESEKHLGGMGVQYESEVIYHNMLEELQKKCTWTWTGNGYKVTGPSGDHIFLPAAGYRGCKGNEGVHSIGTGGYYWSLTPYGSDEAGRLHFYSNGVGIEFYHRCRGFSVRLVQ